jgi:hypothetical protein
VVHHKQVAVLQAMTQPAHWVSQHFTKGGFEQLARHMMWVEELSDSVWYRRVFEASARGISYGQALGCCCKPSRQFLGLCVGSHLLLLLQCADAPVSYFAA